MIYLMWLWLCYVIADDVDVYYILYTHEDKVYAGICIYVSLPWLAAETRWGLREYRIQREVRLETETRNRMLPLSAALTERPWGEQWAKIWTLNKIQRKWEINCDCDEMWHVYENHT